jgi:hypothetical protein
MRAAVNFRVCELATALQLLVVMMCKWSVTPITNPNPDYSQSYTWQYPSSRTVIKGKLSPYISDLQGGSSDTASDFYWGDDGFCSRRRQKKIQQIKSIVDTASINKLSIQRSGYNNDPRLFNVGILMSAFVVGFTSSSFRKFHSKP